MNKLYCFPDSVDSNQYIDIHKEIWAELGFTVYPLKQLKITDLLSRNGNVAVLNWMEDGLFAHSGRVKFNIFVRKILILFFVRFLCHKVIWVRHNVKPHAQVNGSESILQKIYLSMFRLLATHVVTHAATKNIASIIVPHPLYPILPLDGSSSLVGYDEKYTDNLVFGVISRYKNIDGLLKIWPAGIPLLIAGSCKDDKYLNEIKDIINARHLDVKLILRFLSNNELAELLSKARTVIIPHHPGTMIVSGAFYHAISYGCNVLMAHNPFYQYIKDIFPFVDTYSNEVQLDSLLKSKRTLDMKTSVIESAHRFFGQSVVSACWRKLLCGDV